jgi:tetratricopeptide (TPR) repeat protein
LEIKPDFEISIEKLGLMHLHKREYDKAERYFLQYGELGEKTAKSISRADLALIPLSQGKYDLALKILGQGIAADELDKLHIQQMMKYEEVAHIHVEKKEFGRALEYGQRMVKLVAEVYPEILPVVKPLYGYFLVKAGELDSAQKISDEVGEALKDGSDTEKSLWYFLRFMIKYASGDMDQALKEIGEQAERERNDLKIRYWLAVTYLESDMIGEAVQEFERLSNWNILSRARNPLLSSKIPYFLGVCYEKSGWEKRAIEKYEEFLDIWKDADPGIPEVEDAKARLRKLRVQS